mmetsp:Transcript_2813/g.6601  ORF Transcript_2813/g.6601 Transcript_2813/m.6601 type:complete len:100 (+) Transcript_2813:1436-1735(+)
MGLEVAWSSVREESSQAIEIDPPLMCRTAPPLKCKTMLQPTAAARRQVAKIRQPKERAQLPLYVDADNSASSCKKGAFIVDVAPMWLITMVNYSTIQHG